MEGGGRANHGYSLMTISTFLFCFVFLLSFGSLFSTLLVVPPNDVTVSYALCCVSARKSLSLLCSLSHWDMLLWEWGEVSSVQQHRKCQDEGFNDKNNKK